MILNKTKVYQFIVLSFFFLTHQYIFFNFIPNNSGLLGHDYEFFLPNFLFGKIWFENNFLSVPWFSPSFCCGTPFYPDPQTMFYSVQQIFYIIFEPILATKVLFVYFSLIAYLGMFFLLKKSFNYNFNISLLGATLFLFNGFFVYRFIVGHIGYINFVFIPLYSLFLIEGFNNKNVFLKNIFLLLSVLVFSSLIYSGAGPVMPLILCGSLSILLFYYFINKNFFIIFKTLIISLTLSFLISSSKISASLFYSNNFNRNLMPTYFENISNYLTVVFKSLFFSPDILYFNSTVTNQNIKSFGLHEIEFGLSIVPLLSFIFLIFNFKKIINLEHIKKIFLIFLIIFFIPIILNSNLFSIQNIWSKLPILGSSWVQVRWSAFYIIPVIFFTIFIFNNLDLIKKNNFLVIFFCIIIVIQNIYKDKDYYQNQYYNPKNISEFWNKIDSTKNSEVYKINGSATIIDNEGKKNNQNLRNDFFAFNFSSFFCYQPMFGYSLENFPFQKIVFNKKEQIASDKFLLFASLNANTEKQKFNFLNPSCFLFPKENNCIPGDLFNEYQKDDLEKFLKYKSFNFNKNIVQNIFDFLSFIFFFIILILIFINFILFRKNPQKFLSEGF